MSVISWVKEYISSKKELLRDSDLCRSSVNNRLIAGNASEVEPRRLAPTRTMHSNEAGAQSRAHWRSAVISNHDVRGRCALARCAFCRAVRRVPANGYCDDPTKCLPPWLNRGAVNHRNNVGVTVHTIKMGCLDPIVSPLTSYVIVHSIASLF